MRKTLLDRKPQRIQKVLHILAEELRYADIIVYPLGATGAVVRFDEVLSPVPCVGIEIEQVILNLLKNAAQAMRSGTVSTLAPRIVLRAWREGDVILIQVEDNGPGMDEETRQQVFEPFFTTKPPGIGTGLGLAVSHFIVTEHHHGEIAVESSLGKGTRFTISLPLAAEEKLLSRPVA